MVDLCWVLPPCVQVGPVVERWLPAGSVSAGGQGWGATLWPPACLALLLDLLAPVNIWARSAGSCCSDASSQPETPCARHCLLSKRRRLCGSSGGNIQTPPGRKEQKVWVSSRGERLTAGFTYRSARRKLVKPWESNTRSPFHRLLLQTRWVKTFFAQKHTIVRAVFKLQTNARHWKRYEWLRLRLHCRPSVAQIFSFFVKHLIKLNMHDWKWMLMWLHLCRMWTSKTQLGTLVSGIKQACNTSLESLMVKFEKKSQSRVFFKEADALVDGKSLHKST